MSKKLKTFRSDVKDLGAFELPAYSGVRWMMMPFRLEDIKRTITKEDWHEALQRMVALAPVQEGVGYLTIDEAEVKPKETHRRPGIHVDGVGATGGIGGYGGGGGGYGTGGMIVVASHTGCRAWAGDFDARIGNDGDCSHMKGLLRDEDAITLLGGRAYALNESCIHEAIPMIANTKRQFVRLSMPSNAPWHEGYTANPLGVKPTGPIHSARPEFMGYRP